MAKTTKGRAATVGTSGLKIEAEEEIQTVNLQVGETQIKRALDFKRIYSNLCRVLYSPNDFVITFSVGTLAQKSEGMIEELGEVYLPPRVAKQLAGLLVRHVAAFESQHGEITKSGYSLGTESPSAKKST